MRATLFLAIGMVVSWQSAAVEYHVSSAGNDANPGTAEAPFATPAAARDAIRALKTSTGLPESGVAVLIHGGRYVLTQTFALEAADSGDAARPVAYRAAGDGEVFFQGGLDIASTAWAPVTDPSVLERMDPSARDAVRCADLKALGMTQFPALPDRFESAPVVPELFFNDQRMTLARWPNDGWAEIAKVIDSGPAPWRNHTSEDTGTFEYSGDRPERWTKAPAVWLQGYWCFDWSCDTVRVGQLDTAQRRMTLAQPHVYGIGSGNPAARRYFALNLLEELDAPGEYYIDNAQGAVYFWPPAPLDSARTVVSALTEPVIALNEVSHLTLQGLTVETCAGTGIRITGGASDSVLACRIRNTGLDGMVVDGGAKHRVEACDIHDAGTAGIVIGGGDRKTLTPSGHEVVNNHIWRVSRRQRTHAFPLHLSGVGIRVAHNLLHDVPHQAIGLGGNNHVIEFNEIHHTGMECDDSGAFYMGRNPSERGTILRYNFWHDIGSALAHGSCAIYFDDGAGGQTVYGNVFYRAAGGNFGAVFLHGGHDNRVVNNIFVECKKAIGHVPWNDEGWGKWLSEPLWQGRLLEEVDITRAPYMDVYPDLRDYFDVQARPRVSYAAQNVVVRCGKFIDGNWIERDNLITDADPGFANAAELDFRLREDSTVFTAIPGFEDIPFGRIGLYTDTLRSQE